MHAVSKQRMTIMKKAVQMHGEEGYGVVLEAYDAMWGRITAGLEDMPVVEGNVEPCVQALVDEFIAARLETTGGGQKIQVTPLHEVFVEWCSLQRVPALPMDSIPKRGKFSAAMQGRFVKDWSSNRHYFIGVAFKEAQAA